MQAIDRGTIDSLIGWWIESGVDGPVGEAPRDWLRQNPAGAPPPQQAIPPMAGPVETLEAYHHWMATAGGLPMDRAGAVRVAPHGVEGAKLMLMSDLPGREDAAEGRPIGGEAWALARNMLAAIGIEPDQSYVASLSCFHTPGARINGELEACAAIARDHVRLAKPERLLLFGDAPARALLGETLAKARGRVHRVEGVRTVATFHPRWLLQRPSDKALAWRDLLLLMSEND
jgi:DNA polymerase